MKYRDLSIDALKAIAIFMVVYGHSIASFSGLEYQSLNMSIQKIIYLVHMPLFMFLSGMVSKRFLEETNIKDGVLRKIKQLLLPMFFWCLISWLIKVSLNLTNLGTPIHAIKSLYGEIESGYWFIWSLFICSLYTKLVLSITRGKLWGAICGLLVFYAIPLYDQMAIFHLDETKFMLPFYFGGYVLSKHDWKQWLSKIWFFIAALIVFITCCVYVKPSMFIYLLNLDFWHNPFFYNYIHFLFLLIAGFAGIYCFFFISQKISFEKSGLSYISSLGQCTLGIYLIQGVLFNVLLKWNSIIIGNHLVWFLLSVLITLVCYIFVYIFKNTRILKYVV